MVIPKGDGPAIGGTDRGREEAANPSAPVGFQGAEGRVHDPSLGLLALLDPEGGQVSDEEEGRGLHLRLCSSLVGRHAATALRG
jgi:hypothetical protein